MVLTREAAIRAIKMLNTSDELCLVIFDHEVETLHRGQVRDKESLCNLLAGVEARGNTNLSGGWAKAAEHLVRLSDPGCLSRIVLLTDGIPNEGITEIDKLCSEVASVLSQGVKTTTLGFGEDYNEDLLRRMATAGRGNHGFVKSGPMLSTFFEEEITSLISARGTQVRLSVHSPAPIEWHNEVPLQNGVAHLPDLVSGEPLAILLSVEAEAVESEPWANIEIHWYCLEEKVHKSAQAELRLPIVSFEEWNATPSDVQVERQIARTRVERIRQAAARIYQHGLRDTALEWLEQASELAHLTPEEHLALQDLRTDLQRGNYNVYSKKAAMYSHGHGSGHAQISRHYIEETDPFEQLPRTPKNRLPLALGSGLLRPLSRGAVEWSRIAGMLRGHFFGERLARGHRSPPGEGSVLTLCTLDHLLSKSVAPLYLAASFCREKIAHPTISLQKLKTNFEGGCRDLYKLGTESAGCAALRRISPFLLTRQRYAHLDALWATLITHRDAAALGASVGYSTLLNELLLAPEPPEPGFYQRTFLRAVAGLFQGQGYQVRNNAFGKWFGHLDEYLTKALETARSRRLTALEAAETLGSGPYLFEVVPLMLYILELHADDPWRALEAATTATQEADTLGILVGASVGALHGAHRGWFLADDQEEMLDKCRINWQP